MPQAPTGNVPAFLAKLWKLVDSPETDLLISWGDDGSSFVIKHAAQFAREILPYYYKHSNMASFVRQLNMYGFHKVINVDSGGLKSEKEDQEFAHPYFLKGQEHLLEFIKRKVSVGGPRLAGAGAAFLPSIKSEKVNEVLSEVSQIKDRQEDLDSKLDTMRNENEALWREVLGLRQKHSQQQKIVNKLIQFLVALVQPSRMGTMKRRFTAEPLLALEDGEKQEKAARMDTGPIIKDVTNEVGDDAGIQLDELLANTSKQQYYSVTTPTHTDVEPAPSLTTPTNSPRTTTDQSKYRLVDPASLNPSGSGPTPTTRTTSPSTSTPKRPVLMREVSKEDVDVDLTSMQRELDNLKDLLSGQITLDTSLVSSLFNPDESLNNSMGIFNDGLLNLSVEKEPVKEKEPAGELKHVTYNPSLFELTDEDDGPVFQIGNYKPPEPSAGMLGTPELNTPLVQDDGGDPMKFAMKR